MLRRLKPLSQSLCLLLVIPVTACTYLIPPNPNGPRYNTVVGERHRPDLNAAPAPDDWKGGIRGSDNGATPAVGLQKENGGVDASAANAAPAPVATPAAVPLTPAPAKEAQAAPEPAVVTPVVVSAVAPPVPMNAPPLPPVSPEVQARAEQDLATAPKPAPVAAANAGAGVSVGPLRVVPVENAPYVVADSASISSVPPRPVMSGEGSVATKLSGTQKDLEQSRDNAAAAKAQLGRDAAAEPSLLTPGAAAPVIAPPPGFVPPALTPPPPPSAPSPSPQSFVPPPTSLAGVYVPPPASMPQAPLSPIRLMQPPSLVQPPAPPPTQKFSRTLADVSAPPLVPSSSGFNPFAAAPVSAYGASSNAYASGSFLPDSRYSARN